LTNVPPVLTPNRDFFANNNTPLNHHNHHHHAITGFKDLLLKPELLQAIESLGLEHPSQVQQEAIPQAMLGADIICQAKSGTGKTAVFVLACLHQLALQENNNNNSNKVQVLVLCLTRELAYQIAGEFVRFSKFMQQVRTAVCYGGIDITLQQKILRNESPHVVIGTPGRIQTLVCDKKKRWLLDVSSVRHFVIDECDRVLETLKMRQQVQDIFVKTPHDKQIFLFSATMSKTIRPVCRKFCDDPMEIYIDDETNLTLHGMKLYYCNLEEGFKIAKLIDLLDTLDFHQVAIFVNRIERAKELNDFLQKQNFPSVCICSKLHQKKRIETYEKIRKLDAKARIFVSTDLFGRGIDMENTNLVISFDFPLNSDEFLHRVSRAGRFGTRGLGISFVENEQEARVLASVQTRFQVDIEMLPNDIETSDYMSA
jgi:ATP-dependent RNA helicase UAP56/SUB2